MTSVRTSLHKAGLPPGQLHEERVSLRTGRDARLAKSSRTDVAGIRHRSEVGKRTRQEVLELYPGEPRFGAIGLPAVVDDTELEEPARSEQLHALQHFAGRGLIELDDRVVARRPVRRRAPQV